MNVKSSFTIRILTSVKERIRAKSKKSGESINSITERWLILGERADKAVAHD